MDTTTQLHPIIALKTATVAANITLQPFNLEFRLHTWIAREPWAKLWYSLRALDEKGRGYYELPVEMAEMLTGCDIQTIYRWLQDGKKAGSFRRYICKRGILKVWLGSLFKVTEHKNLKHWGHVSLVNLLNLSKIRALTTATTTQALQQKSRYAVNCKIDKRQQEFYGAPHPNDLLRTNEQSSLKSATGQVPFVLHVSQSRIFVSKSFAAFGTSQRAISLNLGIHQRTVQRHQKAAGMVRRQLCQSKGEYAWISRSLELEMPEYFANDTTKNQWIGYQTTQEAIAFFDGIPPKAKKQKPNQWTIPAGSLDQRIFKLGDKFWLAKCNIYAETLELTTMRAARREYRQQVAQCQLSENPAVGQSPVKLKGLSPTGI